jgi:hypothetical protein
MKKLLFIGMMCFVNLGAFAAPTCFFTCTAHLIIVDEEGNEVTRQDATADTCAHAVTLAKYFYSTKTGDSSIYN